MPAAAQQFQASTKSLLRPMQQLEMVAERDRLHKMLTASSYITNMVQDKKAAARQARQLDSMLAEQAPQPLTGPELDAAVKLEREMRAKLSDSMLTAQELRKNPPGATDKLLRWERKHKNDVLAWKNLRLRLHASGALPQYTEFSSDVANLEQYRRQSGGSQELNMEGAQISGKSLHGIDTAQVGITVFNDDDIDMLRRVDPEIAQGISAMDNETRAKVRDFVRGLIAKEQGVTVTTDDEAVGTVEPTQATVRAAPQIDLE